jgi:zinc-ribbon domain
MFCPKCASQNLEGASFCRVCGANISLVPQALSGQLPQQQSGRELSRAERRQLRRHGREPSLDNAFRSAFMGLGFLFVAIALSFSGIGRGWWFWMLIPAFSMMGTGIAQYIRVKEQQKQNLASPPTQPAFQPPPRVTSFPRRNTGELAPQPPSVTEGTTRHLGAEAPTRHLDTSEPNNN